MKRIFPILFLLAGTLIVFTLVSWHPVPIANAQCGTTSTCKTCHETLAQNPVGQNGAWHIDHADYDICGDCHAGNVAETDQNTAHIGVTKNLSEMATSCYNCHTDNYTDYYQRYADQLGGQTAPSITSPSYLDALSNALCVTPVGVVPVIADRSSIFSPGNLILIGVVLAGLLGGAILILYNERRLKNKSKRGKKK